MHAPPRSLHAQARTATLILPCPTPNYRAGDSQKRATRLGYPHEFHSNIGRPNRFRKMCFCGVGVFNFWSWCVKPLTSSAPRWTVGNWIIHSRRHSKCTEYVFPKKWAQFRATYRLDKRWYQCIASVYRWHSTGFEISIGVLHGCHAAGPNMSLWISHMCPYFWEPWWSRSIPDENEAIDAQKNAGQAQILLEELDYSNCWQMVRIIFYTA